MNATPTPETMSGGIDTVIGTVLHTIDYEANPYFAALRDGTFAREDFVETQVQFLYAVLFFSRPMAAVAAKIPSPKQRTEILRNVWEEHGEGAAAGGHGVTFATLLDRLAGLSEADCDARVLWPETRMFNTTLAGAAVLDEYLTGVAMLGIIERMFADIAGWIGSGIVANGWLPAGQLIHYRLHQTLDARHAADFFDVVRDVWAGDATQRYYVEQGLWLGAQAFNTFYEGLYRARRRRWMRTHIVPHVRT
jgi:pyrroloquinoline-quinone synthase